MRPGHERDFYVVTTDRYNSKSSVGRSRLWRLRFDDIANPEAGGTIDCLLDGTEGGNMFDNICTDAHGRIVIQEDIGGNDPSASCGSTTSTSDTLTEVASHNPDFFSPGRRTSPPATRSPAASSTPPTFSATGGTSSACRAHYANGTELVEGGSCWPCTSTPRSPAPAPPDFNGDNVLNSQDFFDFLNAFFAQEPGADFNADGTLNSQDFFDFLNAFFAGC